MIYNDTLSERLPESLDELVQTCAINGIGARSCNLSSILTRCSFSSLVITSTKPIPLPAA